MQISFFISSAIVCALITGIGNFFTTRTAQKIAKETAIEAATEAANKEIEKMERTWQHEELVSSDDEFSRMAASVASFVHHRSNRETAEAIKAIAVVRSKEYGMITFTLDELYIAVMTQQYDKADELLSQAIFQKRDMMYDRLHNRDVQSV